MNFPRKYVLSIPHCLKWKLGEIENILILLSTKYTNIFQIIPHIKMTITSFPIQFLQGLVRNNKGHCLRDYQFSTDIQFENCNDAVVWMFPIDCPSKYNPDIIPLSEKDILMLTSDKSIAGYLRFSLSRVFRFYKSNAFHPCQKSHHYFRFARILRCLWLSGLKREYVSLQRFLDKLYLADSSLIGIPMFLHWKYANNDIFNIDDVPDELATTIKSPVEVGTRSEFADGFSVGDACYY